MSDELDVVETDVPVDVAVVEEPIIEIGLYSRWQSQDGRVFVVVDKWMPQIYNSKHRGQQLLILEVAREYAYQRSREEFESRIRTGVLVRVTT